MLFSEVRSELWTWARQVVSLSELSRCTRCWLANSYTRLMHYSLGGSVSYLWWEMRCREAFCTPVFHTQPPEAAVLYYPHLTLDLTRRQTKSKLNMHCSGIKKKRERSYRASRFKNSYAKQFPVSCCAGAPLRWVQRSAMNAQPILLRREIQVLTLTLLEVKGMKDAHPDAPRTFTTWW